MAGRGRGRGKTVSFDVQALGFGRGEALPAAILQPPPLFPPQEFKPVPLQQDKDYEYMLALKQEFVATLRKSPYYVEATKKKQDIERYSDKYQLNHQDGNDSFQPDMRRLPAELKIRPKKVRKVQTSVAPKIPERRKAAQTVDISKTLETLEKREVEANVTEEDGPAEDKEKDEDEEEEDEEALEEEYDEEELEEETDYAMNYFDNGEGYGDDDDGDDEGPVY